MERNYQMLNACQSPGLEMDAMEFAVYYLEPRPDSRYLYRLYFAIHGHVLPYNLSRNKYFPAAIYPEEMMLVQHGLIGHWDPERCGKIERRRD